MRGRRPRRLEGKRRHCAIGRHVGFPHIHHEGIEDVFHLYYVTSVSVFTTCEKRATLRGVFLIPELSRTTLMKHTLLAILFIAACFATAAAQQKDDPKCKDHPLFTRMPEYWIHHCDERTFNAYAFKTGQNRTENIEGHSWKISYYPQGTAQTKPSEVQILRNYENAMASLGGKVVFAEKGRETMRLTKDGKDYWVEVTAEFTGKYGLTIFERKAMDQDVVANAEALADGLKTTGHCVVNGIYFDTGKSDLKPESDRAIGEIAKLMKGNSSLNLYVVGHTDTEGGLESNMTLSQNRANAVMQALIGSHGIAASRLKAFGNGPYAPVASNDNEDGKARNRRVELVKQ
jgi:OmpA-OmpF porin, OOP family